jgi:hypothetical protein
MIEGRFRIRRFVFVWSVLLPLAGIVSCGGEEEKIVEQNPPTVTITNPFSFSTHIQGDSIQFDATAEDPEDGPLSGASLVWTSNIDGRIGTGTSFNKVLSAGLNTITLTATDSQGATGSESITLIITSIADTG